MMTVLNDLVLSMDCTKFWFCCSLRQHSSYQTPESIFLRSQELWIALQLAKIESEYDEN